jgi:hypothetical protein
MYVINFNLCFKQDRQWLNEALSSCTVNVVEEMNKAIKILKDNPNDVAACEQSLDILADFVDNADVSNGSIKKKIIIFKLEQSHTFALQQNVNASLPCFHKILTKIP